MKLTKCETNNAIVTKLKNVRKHINADMLQIATVCGDTVIVDLKAKEDDLVVYFDSNLCISLDYLKSKNLFSSSEMNEDNTKKGFFGKKGRVKPINLRGEKSYGFVTPIEEVVEYCGVSLDKMVEGLEFNSINGFDICEKYIVPVKSQATGNPKAKTFSIKTNMFPQHWDTKHFKRCLTQIPTDRLLYIEEKEHGTSQRSSNSLYTKELKWYEKILIKFGVNIKTTEWILMNGTRRVNLTKNKTDGFYKGDIREIVFDKIKNHIHKGEQLYYELSGYDTNGSWIQKQFPYGCKQGEHLDTLYRVTMNNEEGKVFDMSREFVYKRAEEIGMHKPHLFKKYYYNGNTEELLEIVNSYTDGKSTRDDETLREGVVVWFEDNNGKWTCLKNKSFDFLNFESKAKDADDFVDIEDQA